MAPFREMVPRWLGMLKAAATLPPSGGAPTVSGGRHLRAIGDFRGGMRNSTMRNLWYAGTSSRPSFSLLRRIDQASDRFEAAWAAEHRPRIEEFLADVPEPERAILLHELLVLELGYRRRAGETPTPADYLGRFPDHPTVIHHALEEASTPAAGADRVTPPYAADDHRATPRLATPHSGGGSAAALPAVAGYDVLDELGKGGMGVVYRARHRRLDRIVALKMIRAGDQAGPEELARFRTEAACQARLQHPNIVQIFEVGETDSGPYFALEFVDGAGLDKQIARTPQPARAAAELVETLARAVQHAHDKGLVHRDLKPSNILVTADGTPKVGDFGLAKRLEGDAGQTQSGAVVGTPSYMAPEQAWGRNQAIGPTTDVYALGAILYEMVTGRPPFLGATPLDTVLQVRSQEPVPVRRLQPQVARDLETICLKCLEKEPARRYDSAAALADDLRRFLDGRPVRARPVSWWGRAVKWAKRRPALVAGGSLALALVLAAWIVGTVLVVREKNRAEENLRLALKAMDEIVLEDLENQLPREANLGPERRATLQRTLTFYEDFTRANQNNPALQREQGRAYLRIAVIYSLLGQFDQAAAAYRRAITFLEGLVAASPTSPAFRQELALCYYHFASQLGALAPAEVEVNYRQAASLQDRLAADFPDVPEYRADLARTEINLGAWLSDHHQAEKGTPMMRQGLRRLEQVTGQQPDQPEHRFALAAGYIQLGLRVSADTDRVAAYRRALALFQPLVTAYPRQRYREGLAVGYLDLGEALARLGQREQAEQASRQGIAVAKQLIADYPQVPIYRTHLAGCLNNLGNMLREAGQLREAEAAFRECLEHWRVVQRLAPTVAATEDSRRKRWVILANLANFLRLQGNPAGARPLLEEAVADQRAALQGDPQNAGYRGFFQTHSGFLAETLEQLGDHAALAKTMAELVQVLPDTWESYQDAARFLVRCAALAEADAALADSPRRALVAAYDSRSRSLRRAAVRRSADNPEAQNSLAWLLATTPDPRLRDAPQAVELARYAVNRAPHLGNYWNTLGVAYARVGDWSEALTALNQSVKLRGAASDSHDWFSLAMAHWHRGDTARARYWYDRAVRWMETNAPASADLRRFRTEAAVLMGLPVPPSARNERGT